MRPQPPPLLVVIPSIRTENVRTTSEKEAFREVLARSGAKRVVAATG